MSRGKAKRIKRPNRIIYALLKAYLMLYLRFKRGLRIRRHGMKEIKPPFVVMGNHGSHYDFAIAALAMKGCRLHVVTATVFYYKPIPRRLLNWLACVPKLQMVSDPVSVRQMLQVIRSGGALGLFPHGQVSYDGRDMPMPQGTGRLIKHMNVPVVNIKIRGAHLSRPKWAIKPRSGRIFADVSVLFTPEQLGEMTAAQIDDGIRDALAFNDYDFSREYRIPYVCKRRAAGLERLLYQCPRCHTLYQMQSRGDVVECAACHNGARMDAYGLLHPLHEGDVIFDDPVQWTAFERDEAGHQLEQQGHFQQSVSLFVAHDERPKFTLRGAGVVTLTKQDLRFEGNKDGKPFSLRISNDRLVAIPFSFQNTYWELPGAKEYYRMVPDQSQSILHMVLALEAAHKINDYQAGLV